MQVDTQVTTVIINQLTCRWTFVTSLHSSAPWPYSSTGKNNWKGTKSADQLWFLNWYLIRGGQLIALSICSQYCFPEVKEQREEKPAVRSSSRNSPLYLSAQHRLSKLLTRWVKKGNTIDTVTTTCLSGHSPLLSHFSFLTKNLWISGTRAPWANVIGHNEWCSCKGQRLWERTTPMTVKGSTGHSVCVLSLRSAASGHTLSSLANAIAQELVM